MGKYFIINKYLVNKLENIFINQLGRVALEDQPLEICERKGLGHPDTICDSVMNEISIQLSKEYLERFGMILHHNVDKSLLAAGKSEPAYRGGKIIEPMRFVFGDRATFEVGNEVIPVNKIAESSASEWFEKNFRFIDPEIHVTYQSQILPGSIALKDIFDRKGEYLGANDTSAAVGYAPFSRTENIILDLEKFLNGPDYKSEYPESGEDIKLMGLRKNDDLHITIAMAMVDQFIEKEKDYFRKRESILNSIQEFVDNRHDFNEVTFDLNALDTKGRGIDGLYLTVLGTSAEAGDSGQVGRGNNVAGVIPLNRPMSSEAAAGKNPVSHVGKVYNALSYRIADRVIERVNGLKEVYVWLLSTIGKPINKPTIVSAQVIPEKEINMDSIVTEIDEIIQNEFQNLDTFIDDLAKGRVGLC
jgi:S-adenosylmethionine synthetase